MLDHSLYDTVGMLETSCDVKDGQTGEEEMGEGGKSRRCSNAV